LNYLYRRSTLNTVQALFRVASHDSTDQTTEAPTVNEVISVLSRAAAKGKFDQRFVEQLEISGGWAVQSYCRTD
jgi:uncharacterized protein (DUF2267 family)